MDRASLIRRTLNVILFFLILITFSITHTYSQENPADSTIKTEILLEEVTVESLRGEVDAENVPASVQVIPRQRIQGAQATVSLEEALRSIPGVFVNNRFNFAQGDRISIRGIGSRSQFGVRGIKIVLDDIPLTFPDGQSQINNIDIASLGKIEVLKGPGGVLYGNSSGGVIYLKSELASADKLNITPSYLAGSYGLRKAQIKFSGRLGKFSYLINTNRTEYEGYRDFSSSLLYNINSVFKYQFNENSSINLILNGNDSPYLLNPGSLDKKTADEDPTFSRKFNQLQGAGKEIRQLQSGVNYSLRLEKNQKINITAYGVLRDNYNPIPGRIIDLYRKTSGLRTTYNKNLLFDNSNLNFTAGYDLEYQVDSRNEFENQGIEEGFFNSLSTEDIIKQTKKGTLLVDQKESILGNSVFAKSDFHFHKWLFSLGVRYDNYLFKVKDKFLQDNLDNSGDKNLDQLNPAFGIIYSLNKAVNIYSNYSSAFQTPSANEFGNLPSGAGGFNEDLKPEKIKSVEAGIRGRLMDNKITYDLAGFYMNITDQLIGYQTADTNSEETFFRNAGKTRNSGLEAFVSIHPSNTIYLDLGYSYNNFVFLDYLIESGDQAYQLKNNKVPGVPNNRFYSSLRYVNQKGFSAELNFQQTGAYFTNDHNGTPEGIDKETYTNKSYSLLDLRISYERRFHRFFPKIYGGANNLLDQKYNGSIVPNAAGNRFYEPAARFNWYLGISLPIAVVLN